MKKVITVVIMIIILFYTNSVYALINDYISLDSDGFEVSGENNNILFTDDYDEDSNISIVIKDNENGVFEITDEQLTYLKKEVKAVFDVKVTLIDKKPKTVIGKNNKYYNCATMNYSIDDLEMFIEQYIILTDHYSYVITIASPNKEYMTSKKVIDFLNSITIQDTITNNNHNAETENSNTTLLEDSIQAGVDGLIEGAIFGGVALIIGLIVRGIGKIKKKRIPKKENNKDRSEFDNNINYNQTTNSADEVKIQLNPTGAWKEFLEKQIGPSKKGKTIKDLKYSEKQNNKKK